MKVNIKNGRLIVEAPILKTPILSSTGKTSHIVEPESVYHEDITVNGKAVRITLQAYIKGTAKGKKSRKIEVDDDE